MFHPGYAQLYGIRKRLDYCSYYLRELAVTGLRAIAVDMGLVLAADKFETQTVVQSFALGPLLLHFPYFGIDMHQLGMWILYVAVFLTVFSGANYMYNLHKVWLTSE